jgi:hypothetical protein
LPRSLVQGFLITVQDSNVLDVVIAHALVSFDVDTIRMGVQLVSIALLEGRCMSHSLTSLRRFRFQDFTNLRLSLASRFMCSCCSLVLEL